MYRVPPLPVPTLRDSVSPFLPKLASISAIRPRTGAEQPCSLRAALSCKCGAAAHPGLAPRQPLRTFPLSGGCSTPSEHNWHSMDAQHRPLDPGPCNCDTLVSYHPPTPPNNRLPPLPLHFGFCLLNHFTCLSVKGGGRVLMYLV